MFKYGREALFAIACVAAPLAAHAQDRFFVGAQAGQARFNVDGVDDDKAATQSIDLGYRWQAGPIVQVGVELGAGRIGAVGGGYDYGYGYGSQRVRVETRFATLGVNARFQLGRDSRWFALARLGAMHYRQDNREDYRYHDSAYHQSYRTRDNGAYASAGIGVDITPSFNVSVMVNGYAFADSPYVDGGVSAGLELRF
jgi:hypothetical protein